MPAFNRGAQATAKQTHHHPDKSRAEDGRRDSLENRGCISCSSRYHYERCRLRSSNHVYLENIRRGCLHTALYSAQRYTNTQSYTMVYTSIGYHVMGANREAGISGGNNTSSVTVTAFRSSSCTSRHNRTHLYSPLSKPQPFMTSLARISVPTSYRIRLYGSACKVCWAPKYCNSV